MRLSLVIILGLYGSMAYADRPAGKRQTLSMQIYEFTTTADSKSRADNAPIDATEAGIREEVAPEATDRNLGLVEQVLAFARANRWQ